MKTSRKLSFLFAALAVPLLAQTPSGSLVFPAESTASFRLNGMDPRNWTTRPSSDARFPTIWNLKTPFPASSNPYDFRLVGTPSAPIRKGETLLATFWMRTISAAYGEGHTRFVVERGRPPYPKSAEWFASAGPEWTLFQIPFVAAEDDAPAGFSAQFWISSGPQEIEIAGFRLVNYGAGVPFTSLGLERYPYPNAAPNAAWREAARARIERLRKGDFLFVLRDPDGKPLANRKMRARMVRHSFGFGTAVDARTLLEDTPNGQRYRDHFFNNFNRATLENDLKWSEWRRDRALALRALDFLRDRGIRQLRGHTVVWPGWAYLPEDVKAAENNPAELRRLVDAHIQDIVGATRGKLTEWDVLNEPYTNRDLERILGLPELSRWFQLSKATDPATQMVVNDFNILEAGGHDTPHRAGLREILESLNRNNAPWDGLGIQGHFDQNLTDPVRVLQILDEFAQYKKPIQITEFDVNVADEALQAAYTRDFLTAAFSHPSVEGISIWGFWAGRIFRENNAMVRLDWTTKPNHQVWRDLVYREWWTEVETTTSNEGVARIRGFAGDYEAIIGEGNQQTVVPFQIVAGQTNRLIQGTQPRATIGSAGIVNAASFATGPVAPGEAVTVFGANFGYTPITVASGADGVLPSTLGDVRILFDGTPAPMIYATAGQASALAPETIAGLTEVQLEYLGQRSAPVTLPVAAASPGIYTYQGGTGQAVVLNNDASGTFNSPTQPAAPGSIITFFLTGEGLTTPPIPAGQFPAPPFPAPRGPLEVRIGGQVATVEFAGRTFPGVLQINARVPLNAPTGPAVPLTAQVSNVPSQAGVTVAVQ